MYAYTYLLCVFSTTTWFSFRTKENEKQLLLYFARRGCCRWWRRQRCMRRREFTRKKIRFFSSDKRSPICVFPFLSRLPSPDTIYDYYLRFLLLSVSPLFFLAIWCSWHFASNFELKTKFRQINSLNLFHTIRSERRIKRNDAVLRIV